MSDRPPDLPLTALKITALVKSRILRRDLRDEMTHLEELPPQQQWLQVSLVLATLLVLALLAASFGWMGLALYFAGVVLLFY